MSNLILGFPIFSDDSVSHTPELSGGSYEATLPLSNLQTRQLHKPARSADDALSSTRLHYDLETSRDVRLWALPKHNFSKTGGYVRVLAEVEDMLFDYEAGDDVTVRGGTFTRATAATYVDRNGIVRTAASGVIRDAHFIDGVRHTLLEPARTNLCLRSNDLTNATWTGAATTVAAAGLDGTASSATTVTDDDAGVHENKAQTITIPNDSNPMACGFWIKKDNDETRFPQIGFGISGGTAISQRVSFNTKTGASVSANAVGGGGTIRVTDYCEDWWLVEVIITNNSTGNTSAGIVVYPAARTTISGADAVATVGSITVGQVQFAVNASFVTSPIFTTTASVTRNADVLTFTYTAIPQNLTAYAKFVNLGLFQTNSADIVRIGSSAGDPRFYLEAYQAEERLRVFHSDAAGNVVSSYPTTTIAYGSTVEGRGVLHSDGSVTGGRSVDGGAEVTAAQSGAPASGLAAAWSEEKIYVVPAGTAAVQSVRIMAGTQTLATMQAAVYDTGWLDAWPSGLDAEEADGINVPFVHIASANKSHRYGSIQIDDTANADGYVELGRLIVAGGYQPTINMSYGARLGLESDTIRTVTDGGAAVYQEKAVRRSAKFALEHIAEAEAFANAWQMQRRLGTSGQVFFIWDASDDADELAERSFLGVLRQLHGLDAPYPQRFAAQYEILEEL